jgi:hypothetical protein
MANRYNERHGIDPEAPANEYEDGDWVLVRNIAKRKLEFPWYGPLKIVMRTPFGAYKLAWPDGKIKTDLVHKDRLKKAHLDDMNNPPTRAWYKTSNNRDEVTVPMDDIRADDEDGPQSQPEEAPVPAPIPLDGIPVEPEPDLTPEPEPLPEEPVAIHAPEPAPVPPPVEPVSVAPIQPPPRPRKSSARTNARIEATGAAWISRGELVLNRGNLSGIPIDKDTIVGRQIAPGVVRRGNPIDVPFNRRRA